MTILQRHDENQNGCTNNLFNGLKSKIDFPFITIFFYAATNSELDKYY